MASTPTPLELPEISKVKAALSGRHIFSLYDTGTLAIRPLIVKAGPADLKSTGGYFIGLDLSWMLSTYHEAIGSFTYNAGFIKGAQNRTTWTVERLARLCADSLSNGIVSTSYASLGVSQQVAYSHTLVLVAKTGQAADNLQFAAPGQTYGIFQTGLSLFDTKAIRYGVGVFIPEAPVSRASVAASMSLVPLMKWLGISGQRCIKRPASNAARLKFTVMQVDQPSLNGISEASAENASGPISRSARGRQLRVRRSCAACAPN